MKYPQEFQKIVNCFTSVLDSLLKAQTHVFWLTVIYLYIFTQINFTTLKIHLVHSC